MEDNKKSPATRKELQVAVGRFEDLSEAIEGVARNCLDDPFFKKAKELRGLAGQYLLFLRKEGETIGLSEFQTILWMVKSCLFLNIKTFKMAERKLGDFRATNPEFESLNSPGTNKEPWKGIKAVLYGPEFNDSREQYRELVRPLARKYLDQFDDGQLDHLERFLPIDYSQVGLRESVQAHLRENLPKIEKWARMSLEEFEEWIKTLSENDLKLLDEELASLNNKQDFSSVKWRIKYKPKKLRAVRQLRFGF